MKRVAIIGSLDCDELDLRNSLKKHFNLEGDDVEIYKDYNRIKNLDFRLFSPEKYLVVIFGPIPHSAGRSGRYSNIIQKMENEPGYAKVARAGKPNFLKISISSVRDIVAAALK